jgi:hypothetical protein
MKSAFKMESYFKEVFADIEKGARMQRQKAATHVKGKIKAKATAIKDTGELAKSAYVKHLKYTSYAGLRAPHAFLVEFGSTKSNPRMTKGEGKKRKKIRSTGFLPANPIVYPTFAEEAGTVERIMSEPWVK